MSMFIALLFFGAATAEGLEEQLAVLVDDALRLRREVGLLSPLISRQNEIFPFVAGRVNKFGPTSSTTSPGMDHGKTREAVTAAIGAPATTAKAAVDASIPYGAVARAPFPNTTLVELRQPRCRAQDCRLLITGCGRSGTHYVADQFIKAGVPLKHEQIGSAGSVSWVYTAPYRPQFADEEMWFADEASTALRASPSFAFSPVVHLVRFPLDAIASLNECFCGCGSLRCGGWADLPSWAWAGHFVEFSNRHCRSVKGGTCKLHNRRDGRLVRAMEYWLHWNRLAAHEADYRFQMESVDLREVLVAANITGYDLKQKPFEHKTAAKRKATLSWADLRRADPALEEAIFALGKSYGYGRESPVGPVGNAAAAAAPPPLRKMAGRPAQPAGPARPR